MQTFFGPSSLLVRLLDPRGSSRAPPCTCPVCKFSNANTVHYYSLSSNSCFECFVEDTGEHCVVADGYGPPSCRVRCQPQGTLQSEPRTLLDLLPATSPCTLSPEGTKL